jgi:hypothetical protein
MTQSTAVATISADNYNQSIMEYLQHGDITKLPIAAQVRLYEEKCKEIGMTSMDRPFSIILFKGKNTLYLTANAANRYAADKNIVRTIASKPVIEKLEGKSAIYVHIRGTLNGRTEEDHYWREIKADESVAVQMSKAQSAARRRITMLFMSPNALQGVISEDDIYQLGLDASKTDESAVTRIVEARATITEEMPEQSEQDEQEPIVETEQSAEFLQHRISELSAQFDIDPRIVKHWRLAIGLKQTKEDLFALIKYLNNKEDRARPYLYTWGMKNLITPDTMDHLFASAIQHKEPGITSWLEFWQKVQQSPDDWAAKLTDLASEAVPQPAA